MQSERSLFILAVKHTANHPKAKKCQQGRWKLYVKQPTPLYRRSSQDFERRCILLYELHMTDQLAKPVLLKAKSPNIGREG